MDQVLAAMAAEAALGGMDIDFPVYASAGLAPTTPVLLGSGSLDAPVGILGRDPGRFEIHDREPFIGKGGQLIRDGFHRARHGVDCPSKQASVEVGRGVFWCNTVPFKPTGNKAWSMKVKRRFEPHITSLIVDHWTGSDMLTCGNVAFEWFGVADKSLRPQLKAFWTRPDRYEASLEIELRGKTIRLHPLPHPSPLNATWYKNFPALLDARLAELGWS
ncbi:MAG: uracil-DNA glycosylase [Proteobacteria bacterium]|nr:uracil-DNA glycosylase [Pseudomonadota bacterium]MCP4920035.1 uracil-DNA glycosylase [Pseudomonadota bacterium]